MGNAKAPTPSGSDRNAVLARLYAMLSRVNRTIVRVNDPQTLYDQSCRIAVEEGGFRAAWVGLIEPAGSGLKVVAEYGGVGFRQMPLCAGCAAGAAGGGALDCPLYRGAWCRIDEVGSDPRALPWRQEAMAAGVTATVLLPLKQQGAVIGVFGIGGQTAATFAAAELSLLEEVADDLSFALDVMRREEDRIATQSKIEFLAFYDAHTGLPNRALCERRLREVGDQCGGQGVAVLAIDLGRYHEVAQVLGHGPAIAIAREVARRLEVAFPEAGVGRVAENVFALWLECFATEAAGEAAAQAAAQQVRAVLATGIPVEGQEVFVDPAVGIALWPRDGMAEEVLKHALVAATGARSEGGCAVFRKEMVSSSRRHLDMTAALRRALERQEFVLHYQPQVDLTRGRITGAEALLRWDRPDVGLVQPQDFIPLLEAGGLISPVGEWILAQACRDSQEWQALTTSPVRVGVNLSARQFQEGEVKSAVRRALDGSNLAPPLLELELTESTILQDADRVIRAIRDLKAEGAGLSLDDFGTGYSSLSYLQRLPVDRIKIDRSFVQDVNSSPENASIIRAVIGMAHSLGLSVVAEGVETEGQLAYLRGLACEEMQGYLFSRPVPAAQFRQQLREGRRLPGVDSLSVGGRVVLVVDDEPHVLNAISRELRRERMKVLTTGSPREAFDILARHPVGVVISDQRMPDMSGTEFLRKVRDLHPDTVRIILSGYTELGSVIEAVNYGAIYKFITKPWEEKVLKETLDEAFRIFEMSRDNRRLSQQLQDLAEYMPAFSGSGGSEGVIPPRAPRRLN